MENKMNISKQLSEEALKQLEEEALRHLAAGACCCNHSKSEENKDSDQEML